MDASRSQIFAFPPQKRRKRRGRLPKVCDSQPLRLRGPYASRVSRLGALLARSHPSVSPLTPTAVQKRNACFRSWRVDLSLLALPGCPSQLRGCAMDLLTTLTVFAAALLCESSFFVLDRGPVGWTGRVGRRDGGGRPLLTDPPRLSRSSRKGVHRGRVPGELDQLHGTSPSGWDSHRPGAYGLHRERLGSPDPRHSPPLACRGLSSRADIATASMDTGHDTGGRRSEEGTRKLTASVNSVCSPGAAVHPAQLAPPAPHHASASTVANNAQHDAQRRSNLDRRPAPRVASPGVRLGRRARE